MKINWDKLDQSVAMMTAALPESEHIVGTTERVQQMYKELLRGYDDPDFEPTIFPAPETKNLVVQKDIPFHSLCAHHVIPFFGRVYIGYIPGDYIIGLSKMARAVKWCAARLQVQEELTSDIANYLDNVLSPQGVMVVVEGRHLCQEMRGVQTKAVTVTSAVTGIFLEKPHVKQEFLEIIHAG